MNPKLGLAPLLALLVAGCFEPIDALIPTGDADVDVDSDGNGDADWWWETIAEVELGSGTAVDILFVVDNSSSMDQEQAVLAEQIVTMARELISPTNPEAPSVDDLHLGIVSTDMGTGGYAIESCSSPMTGDDGVLQNRDHDVLTGCQPTYSAADCDRGECPWLSHSPEHPDDGSAPANDPPLWDDFGCVAVLGTAGCDVEQPLEASLAALTVQAGPGMPNEGFLRDDSLLAIIYLTNEDDCSTGDAELFDPTRDDLGPLDVRCARYPDRLYPVSRYADAFNELHPGRVMVSAISGVPVDGSWDAGDPIDQLRELQQIDPANPDELLPTCDTAMGTAFAPVRLAELVYAFGANGTLESICRQDWTPALQLITWLYRNPPVLGLCADESDAITTDGCRMVAVLGDGSPCPNPADVAGPSRTSGWQVDLGRDGAGRRQCEILAADYDLDGCPDGWSDCGRGADAIGLQGWYFQSPSAHCAHGETLLTSDEVTDGAVALRLECRRRGD